jgi:ATP-dependent DNA helicase RecQ
MTLRAIQLGGGQTESRDKFLQLMRLLNGALCRRRAILSAFGEDLKSPCGVCDICLEPPSEVVVTHQARLALSCVYRARQSFGVQHLIDILLGKCTPKVLLHEHQHLSVFSLGISHTQGFWKDLFKTLIADGLLQVDASSGLTLCLHPDALPVLRGEREILMACRPDLT